MEYTSIDLSRIKTIVLHNRSDVRKHHIHSVLANTHLQYTLFDCIVDPTYLRSGIRSLIHIYSELLERSEFEPVLMLEDDVNITDAYMNTISIPANADCVYLGLSACVSGGHPTWKDIDINLVKITNMLSLHAYVITSERWLRVLLDCMKKTLDNITYWDIPVAQQMKNYTIYGYKKPFFYQDSAVGGQQGPTKITFEDIRSRVIF